MIALADYILGPDGDQTIADTKPEPVFRPDDRVQHITTRNIGTVQEDRPSWYKDWEIPVVWDYRQSHRAVPQTKYLLRLVPP